MIILNERKWAEDAVENKNLHGCTFMTSKLVARLYLNLGQDKPSAVESVRKFIESCDTILSSVKVSDIAEAAVCAAYKHDFVEIDSIPVSATEMQTIRQIPFGRQAERLAFTLLCLAKYWNAYYNNDSSWVNNKDTEIMSIANIKTSSARQSKLYRNLNEAGLISFSKRVDCTNVKVNFCDKNDDSVMEVTDFRNLGNQYLMYIGEPFFVCEECGMVTKANNAGVGRKQKYCKDCAMAVKNAQSMKSAMRKKKITII